MVPYINFIKPSIENFTDLLIAERVDSASINYIIFLQFKNYSTYFPILV